MMHGKVTGVHGEPGYTISQSSKLYSNGWKCDMNGIAALVWSIYGGGIWTTSWRLDTRLGLLAKSAWRLRYSDAGYYVISRSVVDVRKGPVMVEINRFTQ